jgi:hypothetical protein
MNENNTEFVQLICVKEKSKLRVKIITQSYINYANVQFPRDLRIEGRKFKVPANYVNLICSRGKYFYSVKKREQIEIIDNIDLSNLQIYQDVDVSECAICLTNEKNTIFNPCGHFYCCDVCSKQIKSCPICRTNITSNIHKNLVDI